MPITTGSIIALVAGSSVLAAFVNQGLTVIRDWWMARRDAAFSGLYLAIALESYAGDCAAKISDSENYESSGGHAGSPQGNIGDLPDYPATMEWKPFGIKGTTQALSFRVEVETTKTMIRDSWEFGDEDDIVPLVREEAARLGVKALTLAIDIRKQWKIDPVDYSGEWNVRQYLDERRAHYEQKRKARDERNRAWNAELFGGLEERRQAAEEATPASSVTADTETKPEKQA